MWQLFEHFLAQLKQDRIIRPWTDDMSPKKRGKNSVFEQNEHVMNFMFYENLLPFSRYTS